VVAKCGTLAGLDSAGRPGRIAPDRLPNPASSAPRGRRTGELSPDKAAGPA